MPTSSPSPINKLAFTKSSDLSEHTQVPKTLLLHTHHLNHFVTIALLFYPSVSTSFLILSLSAASFSTRSVPTCYHPIQARVSKVGYLYIMNPQLFITILEDEDLAVEQRIARGSRIYTRERYSVARWKWNAHVGILFAI